MGENTCKEPKSWANWPCVSALRGLEGWELRNYGEVAVAVTPRDAPGKIAPVKSKSSLTGIREHKLEYIGIKRWTSNTFKFPWGFTSRHLVTKRASSLCIHLSSQTHSQVREPTSSGPDFSKQGGVRAKWWRCKMWVLRPLMKYCQALLKGIVLWGIIVSVTALI